MLDRKSVLVWYRKGKRVLSLHVLLLLKACCFDVARASIVDYLMFRVPIFLVRLQSIHDAHAFIKPGV